MMRYRRDIDGLRALAIIPVVLFHAGVPALGGGFIGVDIFFVLSGYLITRQLLETEARGLSMIFEFYERRVRRIAPAFLAMLATLLLVVTIFLPAADILRTAKSTVAAIFFAANFRFYGKTGYFDGAAHDEPLLHMWSLAVEEQFYLFFPLLLFLLRPRNPLPVLTAFATASLLAAQLSLATDPLWAFYLLPARAWELLAGALLATSKTRESLRGASRETAAVFGLLLILIPIFIYDAFTPIPGVAALPPVIGVTILLAVGEGSLVGRMLSSAPLVWVGLISYSLYLWHWPIFIVSRQLLGTVDHLTTVALIALSFVVALLSFHYVERPFRNRTAISWQRVFAITGAVAFAISASSIGLIAADGLPQRSPEAERYFQSAARFETAFQDNPCLAHGAELPPLSPCMLGRQGQRVDGILWGDSHAAHWAPMIEFAATDANLKFRQITKAGCPPVPTEKMFPADSSRRQCPQFNARVEHYLLANPDVRYVVLAANWQGIIEGSLRVGTSGSSVEIEESRKAAHDALERLAVTLRQHGKIVLIIGQTPIPDQNVISCRTRRLHLGLSGAACDHFPAGRARMRDQAAKNLLAGAVAGADAKILSPLRHFCGKFSCATSENSAPLYIDAAHLSPAGARKLERDFAKLLDEAEAMMTDTVPPEG